MSARGVAFGATLACALALGLALATTQSCVQFSSGQCTDKAVCDDADGGTFDGAGGGDAPIDVVIDTVVGPDGDVPDGECNGGVEDCANGIDDNCNNLVDCDDPVCQGAGYACTAPPPSGWTGPIGFITANGATIPSCAGAYATPAQTGNSGLSAPAAACGCTCGSPQNVSCNTGIGINYYTDGLCFTSYGGATLPLNFCVTTGDPSVVSAKGVAQAAGYNGDCSSTPSKNVPAVTWSNGYAACSYNAPTDTGGCTGGGLCVQSPAANFWPKPCVYQIGDVACPGAPYTNKATFYESVTDTRNCATCTCTATAATCSGNIDVFAMPSCAGGQLTSITTNGTCTAEPSGRSAIATSITPNPGTCNNNGTGGPIGSAVGATPITVCCAP